jgi:hypothetical protein
VLSRAFKESMALYDETERKNEDWKKIYADYAKFRADQNLWFRFTERPSTASCRRRSCRRLQHEKRGRQAPFSVSGPLRRIGVDEARQRVLGEASATKVTSVRNFTQESNSLRNGGVFSDSSA